MPKKGKIRAVVRPKETPKKRRRLENKKKKLLKKRGGREHSKSILMYTEGAPSERRGTLAKLAR